MAPSLSCLLAMEASLCAFPATKPSQIQPQSHLLSLGFPRNPHSGPCPSGRRRPLLVRAAISRAKNTLVQYSEQYYKTYRTIVTVTVVILLGFYLSVL